MKIEKNIVTDNQLTESNHSTSIPNYSSKSIYLLFILPVIYGVLSAIYYYQSGSFFSTFPDSTYIYLINGTNIAGGNFNLGHYDNPGTPAHWLAGIVIFITHLFIGKRPVYEDVFSAPELYLSICAFVAVALLLLSVYKSGKLILKNTGNVSTALFFQLIPVSSYFVVNNFDRIIPEYLMILIIPYYCAFLWVMTCKKSNSSTLTFNNRNHILFFAFMSAVLITTKITCAPFIIIPFLFINKVFHRILFLFATLIFIALILFPVWPSLASMYYWFKGLATHSGIYGHGKEGVIDVASFTSSLYTLFATELFFTMGYILISIAVIAGIFLKKWKNHYYKLVIVLWVIITAQVILAAKHFSYHYILPSQLLIIPVILAAYVALIPIKLNKTLKYAFLIICSSWLLFKETQSATVFGGVNEVYKTSLTLNRYDDIPKIYTTGFEQSCFVQSALNFGACYGGTTFEKSNSFLRKLYPNSYFYSIGGNYLKWFDTNISSSDLLEKHPHIIVYFLRMHVDIEKSVLKKITEGYDSAVKISLLEDNQASGDKFYLITVDTSKTAPRYTKQINIVCDLEKMSPDKSGFLSTDGGFNFGGAELSSTEQHFSGKTSVKASPKNSFVCYTSFVVNSGDAFDVSVNTYFDDQPGGINLVTSNGSVFNKTSESIVQDYGNGWKRINLKATIPNNYPEKEVRFCLYYFGKKVCYFDDLNITILKAEKRIR